MAYLCEDSSKEGQPRVKCSKEGWRGEGGDCNPFFNKAEKTPQPHEILVMTLSRKINYYKQLTINRVTLLPV